MKEHLNLMQVVSNAQKELKQTSELELLLFHFGLASIMATFLVMQLKTTRWTVDTIRNQLRKVQQTETSFIWPKAFDSFQESNQKQYVHLLNSSLFNPSSWLVKTKFSRHQNQQRSVLVAVNNERKPMLGLDLHNSSCALARWCLKPSGANNADVHAAVRETLIVNTILRFPDKQSVLFSDHAVGAVHNLELFQGKETRLGKW